MKDSNFIISLDHISKRFGDKQVLNDVNLHVKKGEFITILGPSGCGKTTLLRILAGFVTPDEGTVAGSEVAASLAEHDDTSASHVLAAVVTGALDDGNGTAVADTEALADLAVDW